MVEVEDEEEATVRLFLGSKKDLRLLTWHAIHGGPRMQSKIIRSSIPSQIIEKLLPSYLNLQRRCVRVMSYAILSRRSPGVLGATLSTDLSKMRKLWQYLLQLRRLIFAKKMRSQNLHKDESIP